MEYNKQSKNNGKPNFVRDPKVVEYKVGNGVIKVNRYFPEGKTLQDMLAEALARELATDISEIYKDNPK